MRIEWDVPIEMDRRMFRREIERSIALRAPDRGQYGAWNSMPVSR
jgi:hypothetical protein